jgi:hypothetical protein
MKDEWKVLRVACCVVYVFTYSLFTVHCLLIHCSLFTVHCSLLFTPNPASTANTHLEQMQDCAP